MAGTFSQQLANQQQQQQGQSRLSRTQRVILQARYQQDKAKFNALQNEANRIRDERFKDLTYDEYVQEYAKLSPELQQFFLSPSEVTAQIEVNKQLGKQKINTEVISLQDHIAQREARWQEYLQRWREKSSDYRSEHRESYETKENDYELDIREYQDEIKQLEKGKEKIDQGYDVESIMDYADDYARNKRRNIESREKAREQWKEDLKSGKYDATIKDVGLSKDNISLSAFQDAIKKYNKNVAYSNQLLTWAGKEGYSTLPQWTKEYINPQAQEWQKKYPTEVLQFDQQGNVIAVQSTQFGRTIPIEDYNKRLEQLSSVDTSLRLGEKKETDTTAVISGEVSAPFTTEQMRLNEYYQDQSLLQKGFDWVKKTLGMDQEATTPKIETETTYIAPQGMGGGGTAIIKTEFTPETKLYLTELQEFNQKADKISTEIFADYEKNLAKLDVISQENINVLKTNEQKKFDEQIDILSKEFSTDYETGIETIKRGKKWVLEEATPLGLVITPARKLYYNLEDEDKLLKGTTKELFGSGEDVEKFSLKMYSHLREDKYPVWMAREMVGIGEMTEGTIQGTYTAIKENPRTFAFKTVGWTTAIAGATIISSYTGGFGGLATAPAMKWAGVGLLSLYGGSVIARTSAPSTAYERGKMLGTIAGEEILPMGIGGIAGTYIGMKTVAGIDYIYYKYIKKYPYRTAYKITEMDVLKGDKRFPEISPHGKSAQMKAFEKLDKSYLTPDEKALLKSGAKLKVGTHATANRFAFRNDQTMIQAEGREINAMSVSNKKWSVNFFDINKNPSYSLYSGQVVPTGSAPLGLRIDVKGFAKIPSKFKPQLTIKELQSILGYKINPKYFKMTAYLYEKGYFGTGYIAGLKPEIEAYLKGFGTLERTTKPSFYTQIAKPSFYQKLTGFMRKGYPEYALRVEKFSLLKPSTWLDKLLLRQAGAFKPMTKGRLVPLERFRALGTGQDLSKQIEAMLLSNSRTAVVDILKQKEVVSVSRAVSSSKVAPFSISASYPSSYAVQLYLLSSYKKSKSPSASYGKSYDISSKLKSEISKISGYKYPSYSYKERGISSELSPARYSYLKSLIYETPSYPKYPKYYPPRLDKSLEGLKRKMRKKQKISPELQGLFPDFTTRSVGLAPMEFGSVEQAVKEIGRIKTGFEVQRGGRLKTGFKMPKGMKTEVWGSKIKKVGDMDLLKGMMA